MSFYSTYSTDLRPRDEANAPVPVSKPSRPTLYRKVGKRILDLSLVLATAWFTVPVIAILALAVLVTGQSPFYTQDRIGLDGKIFRIWKLRTMLPNAKQRLETYLENNPEARAEWDEKQKLTNDPRITPIGGFLRRSSLDELPQLFNVFNGTMSLIGPRPMMPEQKSQYVGTAYYRLRPGMSGLWQVSKRNESNFVSRVMFDEAYDKVVTLKTDVRVLAQTVGVVLRGTGV
ncbi:sugar transferase [Octadecabacter sp. CECT 8868]|uniref:sugar transferase n=1 Tax=Octadecabacter algicola TaxID=2909342 RepID=UPI001F3BD8C4|nr:sugar transferase [Octadecabacter algicola]MCF2906689.1 sugar transferase [Octadecabacter algicola]